MSVAQVISAEEFYWNGQVLNISTGFFHLANNLLEWNVFDLVLLIALAYFTYRNYKISLDERAA
jgi:hypothetical protein